MLSKHLIHRRYRCLIRTLEIGFLWAILTNRTMLWDYWDITNCLKYGRDYDLGICWNANTEVDCQQFLRRSSWIPSLHEDYYRGSWFRRGPTQLHYYSTHLNTSITKPVRRRGGFIPHLDRDKVGIDSPTHPTQKTSTRRLPPNAFCYQCVTAKRTS